MRAKEVNGRLMSEAEEMIDHLRHLVPGEMGEADKAHLEVLLAYLDRLKKVQSMFR